MRDDKKANEEKGKLKLRREQLRCLDSETLRVVRGGDDPDEEGVDWACTLFGRTACTGIHCGE